VVPQQKLGMSRRVIRSGQIRLFLGIIELSIWNIGLDLFFQLSRGRGGWRWVVIRELC